MKSFYQLQIKSEQRLDDQEKSIGNNRLDYKIQVELNESTHSIVGSQTITYHNNSPDDLPYLWLQLDVNQLSNESERERMRSAPHLSEVSVNYMRSIDQRIDYDQILSFGM